MVEEEVGGVVSAVEIREGDLPMLYVLILK